MIEISGGSGATLRTALTIGLATGVPIRLRDLRARSTERGIGWPQRAMLTAFADGFGLDVVGNYAGSTTVEIHPPSQAVWRRRLRFVLDLDDKSQTIRRTGVSVVRDRETVEDTFREPVNNVRGRGVRGHSVVTPLLALLPLLALVDDAEVVLRGGTETPGAPFSDAVTDGLLPQLNKQFGASITARTTPHAWFGTGGGQLSITRVSSGELPSGAIATTTADESRNLSHVVTAYRSRTLHRREAGRLKAVLAAIESLSIRGIDCTLRTIWYESSESVLNVLFTTGSDSGARDVSWCHEEADAAWRADSIYGEMIKAVDRLKFTSRHHLEQLLLWGAIERRPGEWVTESSTPHLKQQARVLMDLLDVTVEMEGRPGEVCVKLSA